MGDVEHGEVDRHTHGPGRTRTRKSRRFRSPRSIGHAHARIPAHRLDEATVAVRCEARDPVEASAVADISPDRQGASAPMQERLESRDGGRSWPRSSCDGTVALAFVEPFADRIERSVVSVRGPSLPLLVRSPGRAQGLRPRAIRHLDARSDGKNRSRPGGRLRGGDRLFGHVGCRRGDEIPPGGRSSADPAGYESSRRCSSAEAARGSHFFRFSDTTRSEGFDRARALRPRTVWIETPSEPSSRIADIRRWSRPAREIDAIRVAHNTEDDRDSARTLARETKHPALAESSGRVESRIAHPAPTIHASMEGRNRSSAGIGEKRARLPVGIEAFGDPVADLQHALCRAKEGACQLA